MLEWRSRKLFLFLGICILICVVWARVNDKTGFYTERSAWEYCNPVVIGEAILLFCLFSKIHIGVNKKQACRGGIYGVSSAYDIYSSFTHRIICEGKTYYYGPACCWLCWWYIYWLFCSAYSISSDYGSYLKKTIYQMFNSFNRGRELMRES